MKMPVFFDGDHPIVGCHFLLDKAGEFFFAPLFQPQPHPRESVVYQCVDIGDAQFIFVAPGFDL
jgi:hypothetical protein